MTFLAAGQRGEKCVSELSLGFYTLVTNADLSLFLGVDFLSRFLSFHHSLLGSD